MAVISGKAANEALRLSFSVSSSTFEEAWIAPSSGYTNVASGYSASSGSCYSMVLSASDIGVYTQRGVWRPYTCSAVKNYGICEKAV
ncbi:hypothetical protein CAEBREN_31312 [Caenorhabditis brenneri]|uniref:C-type lectin domain-containing protein n=1 Tax=Caenorhabditis brenneri TaxID=135651 RepID=G0NC76_CAEBE|nr:hypothetical protein CAEBREN_31312 [Caenorhabditis brenneri]